MAFEGIGKLVGGIKSAVKTGFNNLKTIAKETPGVKIAQALKDGKIDENELVEIAKSPLETLKAGGKITAEALKEGVTDLKGKVDEVKDFNEAFQGGIKEDIKNIPTKDGVKKSAIKLLLGRIGFGIAGIPGAIAGLFGKNAIDAYKQVQVDKE